MAKKKAVKKKTVAKKTASKKRASHTKAQIEALANQAGVSPEVMKNMIAVTGTLRKVSEAILNVEKALTSIQKLIPSRQVQFMLQDTHSIRSHIGSFVARGPLPPHEEIPLEASELKAEDVAHAIEDAIEPESTEEKQELKIVQ